jgi:hypothetical protein
MFCYNVIRQVASLGYISIGRKYRTSIFGLACLSLFSHLDTLAIHAQRADSFQCTYYACLAYAIS